MNVHSRHATTTAFGGPQGAALRTKTSFVVRGPQAARGPAVLCLLMLSSVARAQITGGAIVGVATDSGGGVLPGVTVTVTNIATNQSTVTHTRQSPTVWTWYAF